MESYCWKNLIPARFQILILLLSGIHFVSAQSPVTSIPFELYGDHIFVKASVDDSEPLDMIFDTGSGITVIDQDVADQLDRVKHFVTLNEGTVRGRLLKHNKIEINNYQLEKNIKVYATNLHHLEISIGREFDGIVGYDFMRHHDVRINYNENILEVYRKGEGPHLGDPVPIKLVHHIPVIEGNVILNNDEPHEGTFFLMTGAGTTLDFNSPYATEYDVIHKTGDHYSYYIKSISDTESLEYEGYIKSLSFSDEEIKDMPVSISQATTGIHSHKSVSGILGNKVLKRYNITYDYKNKMLYMMKNQHFKKDFVVNCSGIDVQLNQEATKVLIHQVFENSPASEANIAVNAELVKINGQNAMEIGLPAISELLSQPDTEVSLVVNENGSNRDISLMLRNLL